MLGQVQVFVSSVGQGRAESLVGRDFVDFRTGNFPYSFVGIDFGQGRSLLPTSYTIRNRNAQTHVMLNWQFEGSNDGTNWQTLDRRVYFSGIPSTDISFENERFQLCQKAATTTWSIDTNIY
jgi:hypothetical protein